MKLLVKYKVGYDWDKLQDDSEVIYTDVPITRTQIADIIRKKYPKSSTYLTEIISVTEVR